MPTTCFMPLLNCYSSIMLVKQGSHRWRTMCDARLAPATGFIGNATRPLIFIALQSMIGLLQARLLSTEAN